MKKGNNEVFELWVKILLGLFAIVAIKSIFENDNSKIVSKKGKRILSDNTKMKDLNKKIHLSEKDNENKEIFI